MSKQYDLLIRLLVIGDSGVGKTCLLCRYVDDQFYPTYAATIGIDFKVKNLVVDDRRVRVQIWDTAGQERFDTITKQYYRRAQGVLLVYDITNDASFRHSDKWLNFIRQYASSTCEVTLVGNKTDLDDWRRVAREEGQKCAEKYGFGFFETSALTSPNDLNEIFMELVRRIMTNQAEELARQHIDQYLGSDTEDDDTRMRVEGAKSKCCST